MNKKLIAGKTESEILSWKRTKRCRWYKTIMSKEKEKAMKIVEMARRGKISKSKTDIPLSEEHKAKLSKANMGNLHSKESYVRQGISVKGEKNPNFNNWSSRIPYCHLWNEPLKEEVRNRWGRVCVLTDLMRSTLGSELGLDDFEGHEIFSSRRFAVHHIRGDKMEGCNGKEMALVPLQCKFNVKKFDGFRLEENSFYITLFLFKDIERKHREEMLGKLI